jgi:hypothetical protein
MNSEEIKKLIPSWLDYPLVERLRKEFELSKEDFDKKAKNPKKWKRIVKEKRGELTLRIFDCKPFDDQLRLYVITEREKIIKIDFRTE